MPTLATETISFTAFGVPLAVDVPSTLFDAAFDVLPPGARPSADVAAEALIELRECDGCFEVSCDGIPWAPAADQELALGMLDAQIRAQVALLAPEHIFVHAGVVAHRGGAIVLPGFSFAGKTTLVHALVGAGAEYLSDEFAVFDSHGLVHPYPKPLSIRSPDESGRTTETPAADIGATCVERALPLRLIAETRFVRGAVLDPQPLGPGAALLALLGHTIPARTRPAQSLRTLKAAVENADAWRSERGEADDTARQILAMLD